MKQRILVSACLMGVPCRYDGRSKPCKKVLDLLNRYELIPVCPEELGGLPTPRLKSERFGSKVIHENGTDVTMAFHMGAERTLEIAQKNGCTMAVLKEKSPSCGKRMRYDGSFHQVLIPGSGVTAELLMQNQFSVFSENELDQLL